MNDLADHDARPAGWCRFTGFDQIVDQRRGDHKVRCDRCAQGDKAPCSLQIQLSFRIVFEIRVLGQNSEPDDSAESDKLRNVCQWHAKRDADEKDFRPAPLISATRKMKLHNYGDKSGEQNTTYGLAMAVIVEICKRQVETKREEFDRYDV